MYILNHYAIPPKAETKQYHAHSRPSIIEQMVESMDGTVKCSPSRGESGLLFHHHSTTLCVSLSLGGSLDNKTLCVFFQFSTMLPHLFPPLSLLFVSFPPLLAPSFLWALSEAECCFVKGIRVGSKPLFQLSLSLGVLLGSLSTYSPWDWRSSKYA